MVVDSKTVGSHLKNNKVLVVGVLIALALSFYGGMRYQSYRIQKAMTSAFSELGKAFGEGLSGNNVTADVKSADSKPKDNPLNAKVLVRLEEKKFRDSDFQDQISVKLAFTNTTDKALTGIQGVIRFMDVFDNEIKKVNVSYDKGIAAGETKTWEGFIDYNQFMDSDLKLRDIEFANLKYAWETDTIVYQDGTKETN